MSEIPGVWIDWGEDGASDPRIFWVPSPITQVSVQDVLDTCRAIGDELDNLDKPSLVAQLRTGGEQDLGDGVFVGLTMTFNNVQLAFEPRTTVLAEGTVTTADPDGTVLTDAYGLFVSGGIQRGWIIHNVTDESYATVLKILTEDIIWCTELEGGTNNTFGLNDEYKISPVIQCSISGGNLVAVDYNGNTISESLGTQGVAIRRTASSSATQIQQDSITFSSYNNRVTIDATSSYTGTTHPVGTGQAPVNNLTDALLIAAARGFDTLYFIGDFAFPAGTYITDKRLVGQGLQRSTFTFSPGSIIAYCQIRDAQATGWSTGMIGFYNCHINSFGSVGLVPTSQDIIVKDSLIGGTITLPANYSGNAKVLNCWANEPGTDVPELDMGSSNANLLLRNFSGDLLIKNNTNANYFEIDLSSGHITLDSSVTDGYFIVRGVGKMTNNSTGATTVNDDALTSKLAVATQIWQDTGDAIYVDLVDGQLSTGVYPSGTRSRPCLTMAGAWQMANNYGYRKFFIRANEANPCILPVDSGEDWTNKTFNGWSVISNDIIVLTGADVSGSLFRQVYVTGDMANSSVQFETSIVSDLSNIGGTTVLKDCGAMGTLSMGDVGATLLGQNVTSASYPTVLDFMGPGRVIQIEGDGDWQIMNMSDGPPAAFFSISLGSGTVLRASCCTGGVILMQGSGIFIDYGTGGTITNQLAVPGNYPADLSQIIDIAQAILQIETGRWKIENNQMIFYDSDDTTPLYVFNLKARDGTPTETNVFEREPV